MSQLGGAAARPAVPPRGRGRYCPALQTPWLQGADGRAFQLVGLGGSGGLQGLKEREWSLACGFIRYPCALICPRKNGDDAAESLESRWQS